QSHPALPSCDRHRTIASPCAPHASTLAPDFPVEAAGSLYQALRKSWTLDDQYRQWLLRGVPISTLNLALGRGSQQARPCRAERTEFPRLARLETRRPVVARVGDGESL